MINFENLIMGWMCCNMSLDGKKKKMNEWNSLINPFFFFRFTWHLLPKSVLDLLDSIFENQRERLPPMRMTETCVRRMHTSHKKLYFILFYFQKWGLVATSRRPKRKRRQTIGKLGILKCSMIQNGRFAMIRTIYSPSITYKKLVVGGV